MEIDVKGWSGKKVEYNSVPYTSIRAFSAESAGGWDSDAEIDIITRNLWDMEKFQQDFRKGKVDIIVIQNFLPAIAMGSPDDWVVVQAYQLHLMSINKGDCDRCDIPGDRDPIAGTTRLSGFDERLAELGWTADTSSLPQQLADAEEVATSLRRIAPIVGDDAATKPASSSFVDVSHPCSL